MRFSSALRALCLGAAAIGLSATAHARMLIDGIQLRVVDTDFSAKSVHVDATAFFGDAMAAMDAGSALCSTPLSALDTVSLQGNCGVADRHFGIEYTITGTATAATLLQFGLDWGRGGFVSYSGGGTALLHEPTDVYWHQSWQDADVINFLLPGSGAFTLKLLGFEDCCDQPNAARYLTPDTAAPPLLQDFLQPRRQGDVWRNGDAIRAGLGQLSGEWSPLAVNQAPADA